MKVVLGHPVWEFVKRLIVTKNKSGSRLYCHFYLAHDNLWLIVIGSCFL